MKSILIESPDYLEAIFKESDKYNFTIFGYGNVQVALQKIIQINSYELIGTAFVYDSIPKKDTTDYKLLLELLDKAALFNKKVLLVTRDSIAPIKSDIQKISNLKLSYLENQEFISDTVINKCIFGSLLLNTIKPYKLDKQESVNENLESLPTLKNENIVPDYVLDIFSAIKPTDNVTDTINFDDAYNHYKDANKIVASLRKMFIRKTMNKNNFKPNESILIEINNCTNNVKALFLAVYYMIGGDALWHSKI